MYSKRLYNRGGKRYGISMKYTHIMPGAVSLAYNIPSLSKEARGRLKWFDYYHKHNNISKVCRYFGISRKTFYYWKKRYNPKNLTLLENRSKAPKNIRKWEVSFTKECRIISLRKQYIRYGKMKLRVIYRNIYKEDISSWKIQRTIEKHNLYYNPTATIKQRKKRRRGQLKKRITMLKRENRTGFLVAMDTIVRYWNGSKRYIITGLDVYSKIAFARMYTTKSSTSAKDFLERMMYLLEGKIENITRDNGTEFVGVFDESIKELKLGNYFSRVRTPTDNPYNERFNRTLQEEFIQLGNMTDDCDVFNKRLTKWLEEYNFHRPHQSLDYMTPIEFHYKYRKALPMYSSSTRA